MRARAKLLPALLGLGSVAAVPVVLYASGAGLRWSADSKDTVEATSIKPTSRIRERLQELSIDAEERDGLLPKAARTLKHAQLRRHQSEDVTKASPVALAVELPDDVAVARAHAPSPAASGGRFSDAELMRYAISAGYSPDAPRAERELTLRAAAAAARRTESWLEQDHWAEDEAIKKWAPYAHWESANEATRAVAAASEGAESEPAEAGEGVNSADPSHLSPPAPPPERVGGEDGRAAAASGGAGAVVFPSVPASSHPRLVLRIGDAARICSGKDAQEYGAVIITLLQRALVAGALPDEPSLQVVVDIGHASPFLAAKVGGVVKSVASTLNSHYPSRLERLELINLPPVLVWMVAAVKRVVHPRTRNKIVVAP